MLDGDPAPPQKGAQPIYIKHAGMPGQTPDARTALMAIDASSAAPSSVLVFVDAN